MSLFVLILSLLAMLATTVVLGFGLYSLFKGGEFGRKWSNKLMRMRVLFQAIAIVLLVLTVWLIQHGK
ncbi:twin transmembrane helix small protein [Asticcacaulis sp. AC460]|uniref:twin transmembrane helix small protein n=1 Tax=Asticcacaulis sp. AC460 TaxID=1282360 RepID=UPI00040549FF|nr:twin transmembrane helix small protein [Asticcacaulis sp. AC460]